MTQKLEDWSLWKRRLRRLALWLASLAATLFVLHLIAREAVAAAVALAPNVLRSPGRADEIAAIPGVLAGRAVRTFSVDVGPPAATLASWILEPAGKPARGTVVLLHGVRMDKRSVATIAAALSDAGYRSVLVDLRGHGASSGEYLTYGARETRDLVQLLDALAARGVELGCLGIYGFSYGGAVAIQLSAVDPRVQAVVAVASFSSLRRVVEDYQRKYLPSPLQLIPDVWFQAAVDEAGAIARFDPDRASPERAALRSRANLLLIHGASDTQVPPLHSQRIASAAAERAKLVILPGATHDTMPADASGFIRGESTRWFERWLGSCAAPAHAPG